MILERSRIFSFIGDLICLQRVVVTWTMMNLSRKRWRL